jgi:hypothetical protein
MEKLEEKWEPDQTILEDLVNKIKMNNIDTNKKGVSFSFGNYSVNGLIKEIREGSEIGRYFYNLHRETILNN